MTEEREQIDLRESPLAKQICGQVVSVFSVSAELIETIVAVVENTTGDDMNADEMNLNFVTKEGLTYKLYSDGHTVELTGIHPQDNRTFKITMSGLT